MAGMQGLSAFGDGLFAGLKLGTELREARLRMQGEEDYQSYLKDYRAKKAEAEERDKNKGAAPVTTTPGAPGQAAAAAPTTGTTEAPKTEEAKPPEEQSKMDPRNKLPVIYREADRLGIDRDVARQVAVSEGLMTFSGDGGKSGGAFQLYTGGGLGNDFQKDTGLDPLDPKNEDATIKYALEYASKNGWGKWNGARRIGLGKWQGIGSGSDAPAGGVAGAPAGASPYAPTYGDFPGDRSVTPQPDMGPAPPPRPQGPAPAAPAAAAPAATIPLADAGSGSTSALTAPTYLAVGDSIATGYQRFAGVPGKVSLDRNDPNYNSADAAAGRTPQEVLDYLRGAIAYDPNYFQGKQVILSSGLSNDPSQHSFVPDQLKLLKTAGAAGIQLAGVGNRAGREGDRDYDLRAYNPMLQNYAKDAGARFGGPLPAVVHPPPSYYAGSVPGLPAPKAGGAAPGRRADAGDAGSALSGPPAQSDGSFQTAFAGARQAPDGKLYMPDPNRPGKYLQLVS